MLFFDQITHMTDFKLASDIKFSKIDIGLTPRLKTICNIDSVDAVALLWGRDEVQIQDIYKSLARSKFADLFVSNAATEN